MSFLFSKESEDNNIDSPVPSLSDTHLCTDEIAIERLHSYAHYTQIIDVSCIRTRRLPHLAESRVMKPEAAGYAKKSNTPGIFLAINL